MVQVFSRCFRVANSGSSLRRVVYGLEVSKLLVADARSPGWDCGSNKGTLNGLINRKNLFLSFPQGTTSAFRILFLLLTFFDTISECLPRRNKLSNVTPRILGFLFIGHVCGYQVPGSHLLSTL